MINLRKSFLFLMGILIAGCSDSDNPKNEPEPYVSINVGDIRQLIYLGDSSTTLFSITGKEKRKDGKEVFIGEWKYGTYSNNIQKYYYAITDSFFVSTELDTVWKGKSFSKENPFGEQRLARLFPEENETWPNIPGGDDNTFFKANNVGVKNIICGEFKDVFVFYLSGLMYVYYARGVGHIATKMSNYDKEIQASYIKVNGKEYGKLWPEKDISFPDKALFKIRNPFIPDFIGHINYEK